jgi:hypothetical protein
MSAGPPAPAPGPRTNGGGRGGGRGSSREPGLAVRAQNIGLLAQVLAGALFARRPPPPRSPALPLPPRRTSGGLAAGRWEGRTCARACVCARACACVRACVRARAVWPAPYCLTPIQLHSQGPAQCYMLRSSQAYTCHSTPNAMCPQAAGDLACGPSSCSGYHRNCVVCDGAPICFPVAIARACDLTSCAIAFGANVCSGRSPLHCASLEYFCQSSLCRYEW